MMTICDIAGHTDLHRKYLLDKTSGRCPKCKNGTTYDMKVLEGDKCPHCDTTLKHPRILVGHTCNACGYGKED